MNLRTVRYHCVDRIQFSRIGLKSLSIRINVNNGSGGGVGDGGVDVGVGGACPQYGRQRVSELRTEGVVDEEVDGAVDGGGGVFHGYHWP